MIIKYILSTMVFICSTLCFYTTHATSQSVTTQPALTKALNDSKIVIVKFHSPQCPHCRSFAPVFEKASTQYPAFSFISIDLLQYPNLGSSFGVAGLPTIIYFVDGKEVARTAGSNVPDFNKQLTTLSKK